MYMCTSLPTDKTTYVYTLNQYRQYNLPAAFGRLGCLIFALKLFNRKMVENLYMGVSKIVVPQYGW